MKTAALLKVLATVKIDTAVFKFGSPHYEDLPAASLPEFAFVGRSNVGKSSLINMLTGQRELAHTSSKPGKTRCLNFFHHQSRMAFGRFARLWLCQSFQSQAGRFQS